ncbi:MAG: prolyl oligopeptidase family serine peptidase [Pseudomonadota bacterium]
MKRSILVIVALWLSAGPAVAAPTVEELVSLSRYTAVALSPEATHIAAATRVDGDAYMIVMNVEDPRKPRVTWQMKPINGESVIGIRWMSEERILFSTEDTLGTLARPFGTGRIYAVNRDGKLGALVMGPTTGTSIFGLNSIVDLLPEDPRRIKVITRSLRGDRAAQLEIVNTFTGDHDIIDTGPFSEGTVIADGNGDLRFAAYQDQSNMAFHYAFRPTADSEWVDLENPFDGLIQPLEISRDGSYALMATNSEGNFGVLRMDMRTMEHEMVLSHDKVPVNSFLRSLDGKGIVGAEFLPGLPEVQYIEGVADEYRDDLRVWKRLHASFPGQHIRIADRSRDGSTALISVYSDRQPSRYYLLDTEAFTARYLFEAKPEIDPEEMAKKEAFWIEARDGTPFQLYVTRPVDAADKPLPTVMVIHGGPHGPRDTWSFNLEAQLLASRGYVVIQPNYRGSGGFGFQFERSGYRKWGREMQDDVTDATLWAFEQGIADPVKTCIYGGSYGGYATLAGITREPGLYACAFAFVGVYDLEMMKVRGDIPDSEGGRTYLDVALGTDKKDLKARSPANHVEKIITPLYIAHGKADKRVPVQQFYNLRKKLDAAEIPYEELLVAREGHGFYALENRVRYYNELLDFLEAHIGPNAPGKGQAIAGLSQ